MKILMITNQVKTYSLGHQNVLSVLLNLGHRVIWAANFSGFIGRLEDIPCDTVHIDITSNPFKKQNFFAYKKLKALLKEEKTDAVYCSTPIGGMMGRIVGYSEKIPMIIYAAHGFLFFKGAPFINRTVYKLEEQILARTTDVLITINQEDYAAAKQLNLRKNGKVYMVHGAGVKIGKSTVKDKEAERKQLGLPLDAFIVISAGYLNQNKNNKVVIQALKNIKHKNIVYLVCGDGEKSAELKELAYKMQVEDKVCFMGFRTDIDKLMAVSDCFVMPSFREGVPRSLLEAMDAGLPCVGSKTRGIADLIVPQKGGYLCNPKSADDFSKAFEFLMENPDLCHKMGIFNKAQAKGYSDEIVKDELTEIFKQVLKG